MATHLATPLPTTSLIDAHLHPIQVLLAKREFIQADILIQEQIQANPNDPNSYYWLGVLYYFQGKIGPAIENLKKVLSIHPRHTDAAVCLSVLLNDIGKYEDAKQVFEQANQSVLYHHDHENKEIDRKFSMKHLELADLYFRYRRYDEAIEEYEKAAQLDPDVLDISIRRSKAYAKKGFLTRAIQELQQLKQENPEYIPARIQLGLLHYSQGNVLDAELEWETVLTLVTDQREALAYLQMVKKASNENSTESIRFT